MSFALTDCDRGVSPTATSAWSQAALPAPLRVPCEPRWGAWQLLNGAGALPHCQPARVAPLTKGDKPCMMQGRAEKGIWLKRITDPTLIYHCPPLLCSCWVFCATAAYFVHWIELGYSIAKKKVFYTQVFLQTFAVEQEHSAAKQATEYVQKDQLLSKRVFPQCNHAVGLQPLPTPQNRQRSLRKA